MIDKEILKKLYSLYKEYGVTEDTISEMMEVGIVINNLRPEIVVYNICAQLAEEYFGTEGIDPIQETAKMFGITSDELSALVI